MMVDTTFDEIQVEDGLAETEVTIHGRSVIVEIEADDSILPVHLANTLTLLCNEPDRWTASILRYVETHLEELGLRDG